ncbi:metal-dependent hydrolase [Kordiimonas sp. SCSIO 12610]|uniref:metal-dependent hydrolase n=1 Tax=Kordiimonas sp. SCSIO 12610 TaxID=2829597 RepID=UPI00210D6025|nr:metal-dependent hydrolase [Kordiimonas sp. SCSIO 12610]UTW56342.1 metal-dependent hydrolase [Kordiimonas sp. SCSIO 12610]
MATIFTHPIVPIVAGMLAGKERVSKRLLVGASLASIIPDADVIAFRFGISYASEFGHRGFTHSIIFAAVLGLITMGFSGYFQAKRRVVFLMMFIGALSHPFLDAFTNGGLGVAAFWPFDTARYFWPYTPIEVSPIGAGFFSARGLDVILSELMLVWLPAAIILLLSKYLMTSIKK